MNELFKDIRDLLGASFPELRLIDEDYGQPESIESSYDTYPVLFPCILISFPLTKWDNLGGGFQRGKISIKIRLAFDCYEDTHYGSGTPDKIIERRTLSESVYTLLQNFKSGKCSPLVRKESKEYSLPRGIKVYETVYECKIF